MKYTNWRTLKEVKGIYIITNTINNKQYIGSSKNIYKRWLHHIAPSVWKQEPNKELYKDMKHYGVKAFKFEVLMRDPEDLFLAERQCIEAFNPEYNKNLPIAFEEDKKESRKRYYQKHYDERNMKQREYDRKHSVEKKEYLKKYYQEHKEEQVKRNAKNFNRKCIFEGEELTLNALTSRFRIKGIPNYYREAKKYLVNE